MKFQVGWKFNNAFCREHGKKGNITVDANSEEEACESIKRRVSRELFGTTGMQSYVAVSDISKTDTEY